MNEAVQKIFSECQLTINSANGKELSDMEALGFKPGAWLRYYDEIYQLVSIRSFSGFYPAMKKVKKDGQLGQRILYPGKHKMIYCKVITEEEARKAA